MRAGAIQPTLRPAAALLSAAFFGVGGINLHLALAAWPHRETLVLEPGLLRGILLLQAVHALLGLLLLGPLLWFLVRFVRRRPPWLDSLLTSLPRAAALVLLGSTLLLSGTLSTARDEIREISLAASSEGNGGPNVLLIVADSMRRDLFDDREAASRLMPNLSALRRESVDYSELQAASSWTPPSMASLLTGLRPSSIDAHRGKLPVEATSLAEQFHGAGYQTVGITDNYLTHPVYGFAQGFESYWQKNNCILFAELWIAHWRLSRWYEWLIRSCRVQYRGAPAVNEQFMRWAGKRDESRPFFAMLHYMDTHYPYYTYPEHPDNVANQSRPEDFLSYADAQHSSGIDPKPPFARSTLPANQLNDLRLRYRGSAQYLDGHVGEILGWLAAEGLKEETIVVFTADHGEEFLEHRYLAHGRALYAESIRVPLFIRIPGTSGLDAHEIDLPVGMAQIAPSLLALSGLPAQPEHPMPLPSAPMRFGEAVYSELDRGGVLMVAGRYDQMKLIYSRARNGRERLELYDLGSDAAEFRDISADTDDLPAEIVRQFSLACESLLGANDTSLTDQQIELLRGLGYLN